jgi:hypothetical protein
MRNGFLWALGITLSWAALAHAQTAPSDVHAQLLPPLVAPEDSEELTIQPGVGTDSDKARAQRPIPSSAPARKVDPVPFPGSSAEDGCCSFIPSCLCCDTCCPPYPAFWASADYLLWFVKSGPVNGPLVTAGSPADPVPGALGQPGTQVLFGNSLNYNPLSGARFNVGVGLTSRIGLEAGYFLLERGAVGYTAASDAAGPPSARPYFDTFLGIPNAAVSSLPGVFAGSTTIASHSRLQGYEVNLAGNITQTGRLRLDALAGFRALDLNEDLSIQDTMLPPGSANLNFGNVNVPAGSIATDYDKFRATNHFFGGQAGARMLWFWGNFSVGMTAKVALGATQQLATIDGASAVLAPGAAPSLLPGGLLAQTSNIGRFYRDEFTVVPEAQFNLGWQVRPWMRLSVGYTFIYWSNVLRPGAQIDRNINGALIPTGQSFGLGNTAGPPLFSFHGSDFWAQGISFGALFSY